MNYDTAISETVPLYRVLDEMLLDGTSREVIVSFLKSHERSIPDIYAHSAFVYDLYDPYFNNPSDFDGFLVENAIHLPKSDCMFFVMGMMRELNVTSDLWSRIIDLGNTMHRKWTGEFNFGRRGGWDLACRSDGEIADGDVGLIEHVSTFKSTDEMKSFIIHSRFSRNLFQAKHFLTMDAKTQCIFLNSLFARNYGYGDKSFNVMNIVAEMTASLLKQFLVVENLEMFNWVMNVAKNYCEGGEYSEFMICVRDSFYRKVPVSIKSQIKYGRFNKLDFAKSLPEMVFEMNMVETQFEPMDLFLFLYLLPKETVVSIFSGDNLELTEFFNLPFNWRELEYFNGVNGNG